MESGIAEMVGVQLYSVRQLLTDDPVRTVRGLAEIGYRWAELGGQEPSTVVSLLRENGIEARGAHVQLCDLAAPYDRLAELAAYGFSDVALAWVGPADRARREQVERLAELLGEAGRAAASLGMRMLYHNHEFEYQDMGGWTVDSVLRARLEGLPVYFELDVYHCTEAGVDAAAQLRRLAGRVPLVHAKDMSKQEGRGFVPVGEGRIDWPGVLASGRESGVESYIVEQDSSRQPLVDLRTSWVNLIGLLEEAE